MFTEEQKNILSRANIRLDELTERDIFEIATKLLNVAALTDSKLVEFLKIANALYRGGHQIITDADYDFIFLKELEVRHPNHAYLKTVEPEVAYVGKTVDLPVRMLSTEKAYSYDEIKNWVGRIRKAAIENGIDFNNLFFRVTPKLDGFAAYDDGQHLYTRGDGRRGTDITRVFDRGLVVVNDGSRDRTPAIGATWSTGDSTEDASLPARRRAHRSSATRPRSSCSPTRSSAPRR